MRSVSFTIDGAAAIAHIRKNGGCGQGIGTAIKLLEEVVRLGDFSQQAEAEELRSKIRCANERRAVVYAINVSNLGPRIVKDKFQPFLHFYWDPQKPLPLSSEITPMMLFARLDLKV